MGVTTIDTWAPQIDSVLEKEEPISKEPEELKIQLKKLEVSELLVIGSSLLRTRSARCHSVFQATVGIATGNYLWPTRVYCSHSRLALVTATRQPSSGTEDLDLTFLILDRQ